MEATLQDVIRGYQKVSTLNKFVTGEQPKTQRKVLYEVKKALELKEMRTYNVSTSNIDGGGLDKEFGMYSVDIPMTEDEERLIYFNTTKQFVVAHQVRKRSKWLLKKVIYKVGECKSKECILAKFYDYIYSYVL